MVNVTIDDNNMKNPPSRGNYCFSSITERELESALLLINFRLIIQHHVNPLLICVAYTCLMLIVIDTHCRHCQLHIPGE